MDCDADAAECGCGAELREPGWIQAIGATLRRGQAVRFFDARDNGLRTGMVLEMHRKQVVVLDTACARRELIDYAAINLDDADVSIREQTRRGLRRQDVVVGDILGFQDRQGQQHRGKVIRLNTKTVSLDGLPWRGSYALLHRLIDADAYEHNPSKTLAARLRRRTVAGNAAMESWNRILKVEAIPGERFDTRADTRAHVVECIEVDYNQNRLPSTLGYLSPEQFELSRVA